MGREHEHFKRKIKNKTLGAIMAATILRGVGLIACPGDEIALVVSQVAPAFAKGFDQTQQPDLPAILPDKPKVVFSKKSEKKPLNPHDRQNNMNF
jgi:hypothetical protein